MNYNYLSNNSFLTSDIKNSIEEIFNELDAIYENREKEILAHLNDINYLKAIRHVNDDYQAKQKLKNILKNFEIPRNYAGQKFSYVFPVNHGQFDKKNKSKSKGNTDNNGKPRRRSKIWNTDAWTWHYKSGLKFIVIALYKYFEVVTFEEWCIMCKVVILKLSLFVDDMAFTFNKDATGKEIYNQPIYLPVTKYIKTFPYRELYEEIYVKEDYSILDINGYKKTLRKNFKYDKMTKFSKEEVIELIEKSKVKTIAGVVEEYNKGKEWYEIIKKELFRYYVKKYDLTHMLDYTEYRKKPKPAKIEQSLEDSLRGKSRDELEEMIRNMLSKNLCKYMK